MGPIGLTPGYSLEFKSLSFPPQAGKAAERNWTLSGEDKRLNSQVKKKLFWVSRNQIQVWDIQCNLHKWEKIWDWNKIFILIVVNDLDLRSYPPLAADMNVRSGCLRQLDTCLRRNKDNN